MEEPPELHGFGVALEGRRLGEVGTFATLREHLGALRRADVIQSAAKLLQKLEAVENKDLKTIQFELIELFPPATHDGLRALLTTPTAKGGVDVLFYPQQLRTLAKLAMALGEDGPPTSFDAGQLWPHFLLAAAQVTDVAQTFPSSLALLEDNPPPALTAMWALRNGHANKRAYFLALGGRAFLLWFDSRVPWPAGVMSPDAYTQERFGLSLAEFIAVATTPAFLQVSDRNERDPGDIVIDPEKYFKPSRFTGEQVSAVIGGLVHDTLSPEVVEDEATYWSFADLQATPYLHAPEPLIAPASVSYAFERGTTGVFWMLHAELAGEVGEFTTHFGRMFEDYGLRIAETIAGDTTLVRGEIAYGTASRPKKSCDMIITTTTRLGWAHVFIECTALRPSLPVLAHGDPGEWQRYLDRLSDKLRQLSTVITDFKRGEFAIPSDPAPRAAPILPLVVVDEPFEWTFVMRDLVDGICVERGLFRQPDVARPVIGSLDEFENLVAAGERGANLGDLVRGVGLAGRGISLERHVFDETGVLHVPRIVEDGFARLTEMIMRELDLPKS